MKWNTEQLQTWNLDGTKILPNLNGLEIYIKGEVCCRTIKKLQFNSNLEAKFLYFVYHKSIDTYLEQCDGD